MSTARTNYRPAPYTTYEDRLMDDLDRADVLLDFAYEVDNFDPWED